PAGCVGQGVLIAAAQTADGDRRALELYRRACDGGHADGCNDLAMMIAAGRGEPLDLVRAFELASKACDGGSAAGCANTAYALLDGDGAVVDHARAGKLLAQACDRGLLPACVSLALLHERGS